MQELVAELSQSMRDNPEEIESTMEDLVVLQNATLLRDAVKVCEQIISPQKSGLFQELCSYYDLVGLSSLWRFQMLQAKSCPGPTPESRFCRTFCLPVRRNCTLQTGFLSWHQQCLHSNISSRLHNMPTQTLTICTSAVYYLPLNNVSVAFLAGDG